MYVCMCICLCAYIHLREAGKIKIIGLWYYYGQTVEQKNYVKYPFGHYNTIPWDLCAYSTYSNGTHLFIV